MDKVKLTKSKVEGIKPPESGELLIWDADLPGYGLRIVPSGTRSYIVQRRVNGKQRRITLGRHGVLTADMARKRASVKLGEMADGVDPVFEREKQIALAVTLKEVVEGYLKDRRTKSGLPLKERTKNDIERHLKSSFEAWKDRPVVEITRSAVSDRYRELVKKSPAQAAQAMRVLRALMNYARAAYRTPDDAPILPENPVSVLSETKSWTTPRARNTYIKLNQVGVFWNALQTIRADKGSTRASRTGADIVAFLMLTGLRWSEASELKWDHVDLDKGTFRLSDPKNRNPVTFPLSDAALSLLSERPQEKWVFPARHGDGHVLDARPTLRKIEAETEIRATPHDLRRTFRALAGDCGIELWKTKLLMNHTLSGDVTITNYTDTENLEYLKPEADLIAEKIEEKAAIARAENITDLESAKSA